MKHLITNLSDVPFPGEVWVLTEDMDKAEAVLDILQARYEPLKVLCERLDLAPVGVIWRRVSIPTQFETEQERTELRENLKKWFYQKRLYYDRDD